MKEQIRIEGMDELADKLHDVSQLKGVIGVMSQAAVHVKGKIAKYPPKTKAQRAKVGKWYERGYGWRWKTAGGILGGEKTSEILGKSWAMKAGQRGKGFFAEVGTNVSYAEDVQGPNQKGKFADIGWKTTDTVADEERNTVLGMIKKQVDRILGR